MKIINASVEFLVDPFFALESGLIKCSNTDSAHELFRHLNLLPDDWLRNERQLAAYLQRPSADKKGATTRLLRLLMSKALPIEALTQIGEIYILIENIVMYSFIVEDGEVLMEEVTNEVQQYPDALIMSMSDAVFSGMMNHIAVSSAKWTLKQDEGQFLTENAA